MVSAVVSYYLLFYFTRYGQNKRLAYVSCGYIRIIELLVFNV